MRNNCHVKHVNHGFRLGVFYFTGELVTVGTSSIAPTVSPGVTPAFSGATPDKTGGVPGSSSPTTPGVPSSTVTGSVTLTCKKTGWTQWFNTHSLDSQGDIESLPDIRKKEDICPEEYTTQVECRRVGDMQPLTQTEDLQIVCNTKAGLACFNQPQGEKCPDFEMRVYCDCSQGKGR